MTNKSSIVNNLFDAIVLHQSERVKSEFIKIKDEIPLDQWRNLYMLTCRYGDATTLQTLIDGGATFNNTHLYILSTLDNCTWLSLEEIFDFYSNRSFDYIYYYRLNNSPSTAIEPVSKETRLEIVNLLLNTYKSTDINAELLLFYAIITQNHEFVELLRSHDVHLSDKYKQTLFSKEHSITANDDAWNIFSKLVYKPSMYIERYFNIIEDLRVDCPNAKVDVDFGFTSVFGDLIINSDFTDEFIDKVSFSKINKKKFMMLNAYNKVEYFPIYEKLGWLSIRKTREDILQYATETNNVELTAWLMEFKNRTVDIEKERLNDEKKMMRELTAAPDSTYMMKQLWSIRKCEGGLCVTNYKGDSDKWEIPAKIGRTPVVEVNLSNRVKKYSIHSIIIPEGVKEFHSTGNSNFNFYGGNLCNLTEVKLPSTLVKISANLFSSSKITSIEIPSSCKIIESYAFAKCPLTKVVLNEGLETIETGAFYNCTNIKEPVIIPKSVTYISDDAFDVFYNKSFITTKFVVHRDSYAHQWYEKYKLSHKCTQCEIID